MIKTKSDLLYLAVGGFLLVWSIFDLYKMGLNYGSLLFAALGLTMVLSGSTFKSTENDERSTSVRYRAGFYSNMIVTAFLFVMTVLYRNGVITSDTAVYSMFLIPLVLYHVIAAILYKRA